MKDDYIKKAELYIEQMEAMRENCRHITSLEGVASFIKMFNKRLNEIKDLLSADPVVLQSVEILEPLSPDTEESEYPAAIIEGKLGQFMVHSGVLLTALKNFIKNRADK